jgi:hypothetical protein
LSVLRGWKCPLKMRPCFFNFNLHSVLIYVWVYQMTYSLQVFRLRFWVYFSSLPQVPLDFSSHYPGFYILICVKIKQTQLIITHPNNKFSPLFRALGRRHEVTCIYQLRIFVTTDARSSPYKNTCHMTLKTCLQQVQTSWVSETFVRRSNCSVCSFRRAFKEVCKKQLARVV